MNYPLFGIIYNNQGIKEENYLYTASELKQFDIGLFNMCVLNPGAWHDSHLNDCACKTWMGTMIENDDMLWKFLKGDFNSTEQDNDWYWENVKENDLYGGMRKSVTMRQALTEFKQRKTTTQFYFNNKPCSLEKIKEIFENLEICPADGGSFETLEVEDIKDDGIYFTISGYSTF